MAEAAAILAKKAADVTRKEAAGRRAQTPAADNPAPLRLRAASERLSSRLPPSNQRVADKPASALKTAIFLIIAVLTNSFGNLLLALAMGRMPSFTSTPFTHYLYLLAVNPYLLPGTALSAMYMVAQLSLFSWADLSFVVPVIASSYVVTAFLSEFILGESVQAERWVGVILITVGVALVARTPPATGPKAVADAQANATAEAKAEAGR